MFENGEKRILIYGGGKSGTAAARHFAAVGGAQPLFFDDDNECAPPSGTLDVRGAAFEEILKNAELVLVAPSVPASAPLLVAARRRHVTVDTELSYAAKRLSSRVLAVTGTDGKTTVASLAWYMLQKSGIFSSALGNIGTPVLDALLNPPDVAVLEASSFQLTHAAGFHPSAAAILNIAPDHLNWHKSFGRYVAAKYRIFENMDGRDCLILNADDFYSKRANALTGARTLFFSRRTNADACVRDGQIIVFGEKLMPVSELWSGCGYNLENALAATLLAECGGATRSGITEALATFMPPEHRMEKIFSCEMFDVYEDSKATSPHATLGALSCVEGSVAVILGGSDKGEDYTELFFELKRRSASVVIFGANEEKLRAAAEIAGVSAVCVDTMRQAVLAALEAGACNVLFSPASASFDRYASFEERGDAFRAEIEEILS